jgi:predicted nucleic acid-binding Zn ribbon protein
MSNPDESRRHRPSAKYYRRFRTVGSVLPKVVKRLKLQDTLAVQPAVNRWPEIVGDKVARHTHARSVDGKTLIVAVSSPVWMTQLTFLKPRILEKIAARIGKGLITDIRFVPGPDR